MLLAPLCKLIWRHWTVTRSSIFPITLALPSSKIPQPGSMPSWTYLIVINPAWWNLLRTSLASRMTMTIWQSTWTSRFRFPKSTLVRYISRAKPTGMKYGMIHALSEMLTWTTLHVAQLTKITRPWKKHLKSMLGKHMPCKMVYFLIGHYTYRMFPPAIDIIPTSLAVVYSNGTYTN